MHRSISWRTLQFVRIVFGNSGLWDGFASIWRTCHEMAQQIRAMLRCRAEEFMSNEVLMLNRLGSLQVPEGLTDLMQHEQVDQSDHHQHTMNKLYKTRPWNYSSWRRKPKDVIYIDQRLNYEGTRSGTSYPKWQKDGVKRPMTPQGTGQQLMKSLGSRSCGMKFSSQCVIKRHTPGKQSSIDGGAVISRSSWRRIVTALDAKWDQAHNWYRHLTEDQDQPPQPHRPIYKPMERGGRARRGLTVVENTYHEQERYEANFAVLKIDYANHAPMLPLYKWPGSRKCYLVLHLFSGRRREGDLHDHLQRMAQGKDYDIKVFSMDLAVDEHYGDLSPTSATWLKVKEGLTKGIFAAGLAGSPCNTYSEARYHQPEDTSRKWPRPVRTRAEPCMGTPPTSQVENYDMSGWEQSSLWKSCGLSPWCTEPVEFSCRSTHGSRVRRTGCQCGASLYSSCWSSCPRWSCTAYRKACMERYPGNALAWQLWGAHRSVNQWSDGKLLTPHRLRISLVWMMQATTRQRCSKNTHLCSLVDWRKLWRTKLQRGILCGRFEVRPLRLKLCWRFQIPRPNFIVTSS